MKLKKNLICEMLFFVLLAGNAYSISNMSTDSTYSFFYWGRDNASADQNAGCSVVTKVKNADTAVSEIGANAVFTDDMSKNISNVQISVFNPDTLKSQSKPSNIIGCSEMFEKCEWLNSIDITYMGKKCQIKLSFPILKDSTYKRYNYFVDSINDSINLRFQAVNDTVFMGSYLNTKRWNEPQKWLVSKGAVMVLVSNNTKSKLPLRIKSVQLKRDNNPEVNKYLGIDFSEFDSKIFLVKENKEYYKYYGIDFLRIVPSLIIKNVVRADTVTLKPGSKAKINWKFVGKAAEIDTYYVYAKCDNDSGWGEAIYKEARKSITSYTYDVPKGVQDSFKIRIALRGLSKQFTEDSSGIIYVKSFRFRAEAVGDSSIALSWNPGALDKGDSLVIGYAKTNNACVKPNSADVIRRAYTDFSKDADTISGLIPKSIYYFGAYLYNQNKYTIYGTDSIEMKDITPPKNPYELTSSKDSLGNVIVTWKNIVPVPIDVCSIMVIMSSKSFLQMPGEESCSLLVKSIPQNSSCTLGILKNTRFVSLLVADKFSNWSKSADPARVKILAYDPDNSEMVAFPLAAGTMSLFDDNLRIGTEDQTVSNDVVEKWKDGLEVGTESNFVVVSQGYVYYRENEIKKPMSVDVAYSDSSLGKLSPQLIRLFYYNDEGEWMAVYEPVKVDSVNKRVSSSIPDSILKYPFIFMVDTMPPQYTILTKNVVPIADRAGAVDTVIITDNVKNIKIEHFAGAGKDLPVLINSVYTTKTPIGKDSINVEAILLAGYASANSGLVSYLRIADNTYVSNANLSRSVKRNANNNSDNVTVAPGGWAPLVVSADLDSSELSFVMNNSSAGKTNWSYDKKQMRIIKWDPLSTNKFNDSWVEYDSTLSSGFTFKCGSFFWIKTRDTTQIKYGAAIIPPLIDTTPVKLNENEWTDFSNPYPFDISMVAIRDASISKGVLKTELENLQIYSWDKGDSLYSTKQEYLKGMPELEMEKATIKAFKPYTIKNPSEKSVSIYFPPISTAVISGGESGEHAALAKRAALSKKRSFRVNPWVKNGSALSSVYCGYNESLAKDARYSIPPSFSQQRVAVCDEMWKAKWGSVAFAKDTLGGNFYELLFENMSSSKATICASVDYLTGIDNAQKIQWFDMEKNEWIDSKETMEVELNPNQSIVRIVAIGGDQFFREFVRKFQRSVLSLKSIYPNPFGRVFTIKYSLPYQVQNLSFVMFNIRGQQVWKKDVINYRPGVAHLRIDQKVAAGAYVLQMRAKVEGASPKVFNRMIMCTK